MRSVGNLVLSMSDMSVLEHVDAPVDVLSRTFLRKIATQRKTSLMFEARK